MSMAKNPVMVVPLVWSGAVTCLEAKSRPKLVLILVILVTLGSSIQARAKSSLGRRATE